MAVHQVDGGCRNDNFGTGKSIVLLGTVLLAYRDGDLGSNLTLDERRTCFGVVTR
ncbi:hypothetical protein SDC9_72507 [bioreactor metagenome]|uniref:Uncharacterized protein n=1 Tax=bioreactor metagenome TaxID=1076179 RepID=A0A644YBS5_9ZZZZ